jgi:cytochrome c553
LPPLPVQPARRAQPTSSRTRTFPEVYQVPMIGGQSAKYIEAALQAYKKGDRKHPSMRGIATSLSDQDIADIAAYYAQQSGATPNK